MVISVCSGLLLWTLALGGFRHFRCWALVCTFGKLRHWTAAFLSILHGHGAQDSIFQISWQIFLHRLLKILQSLFFLCFSIFYHYFFLWTFCCLRLWWFLLLRWCPVLIEKVKCFSLFWFFISLESIMINIQIGYTYTIFYSRLDFLWWLNIPLLKLLLFQYFRIKVILCFHHSSLSFFVFNFLFFLMNSNIPIYLLLFWFWYHFLILFWLVCYSLSSTACPWLWSITILNFCFDFPINRIICFDCFLLLSLILFYLCIEEVVKWCSFSYSCLLDCFTTCRMSRFIFLAFYWVVLFIINLILMFFGII